MQADTRARLASLIRGGRVVLASKSPRRIDILKTQLGIDDFDVVPSNFRECLSKDAYAPFEYVVQTAIRKALDVYEAEIGKDDPPALLIAADTIVVDNGMVLEKPRGIDHHVAMLKQLRDAIYPQRVYTGVVVIVPLDKPVSPGYAMESYLGESQVTFRKDITDDEIIHYVSTREGNDAAGGYKIQGQGRKFIKEIKGDISNIVGLPINGTASLIEKTFKIAAMSDSDESEGEYEDSDKS